jgi:hypothetical protein
MRQLFCISLYRGANFHEIRRRYQEVNVHD